MAGTLEEVTQERDAYFLLILRLIHADTKERNRILDAMKPNSKRPRGRPKANPKSKEDFVEMVELFQRELSESTGKPVSIEKVLMTWELWLIQKNNHRISRLNSSASLARRKTHRNLVSQVRQSRKMRSE